LNAYFIKVSGILQSFKELTNQIKIFKEKGSSKMSKKPTIR